MTDDAFREAHERAAQELAVFLVDMQRGFTDEFASDPEEHRHQYDLMQERVEACLPAFWNNWQEAGYRLVGPEATEKMAKMSDAQPEFWEKILEHGPEEVQRQYWRVMQRAAPTVAERLNE